MDQDLDKIINLLNEMQRTNEVNSDNFNRLLSSIEEKADSAGNESSINLIRTYTDEITKSMEDKYSTTLDKFHDIEQALKAVYSNQDYMVKNSDIKELFDIFSKNVNNLYSEARQGKAILNGIETKLSDMISNKTDKEDILRTISLLRNDFGNINLSYKNITEEVNSNLKSILSRLINLAPLNNNEKVISQIEIVYKSISDIITRLQSLDDRDARFEKILSNVATNDDLKIAKEIIDSIVEKTNEIKQKLELIPEKSDITDLQNSVSDVSEKTVTTENIEGITKNLLTEIDDIKQNLGLMAQNIEEVPNSENLSQGFGNIYSQLDMLINGLKNLDIRENISQIDTNIKNFNEELGVVKNIVSDFQEVIVSKISQTLGSVTSENSEGLKQSITEMLSNLPQKDDIDKILSVCAQNYQSLSQKTDNIAAGLKNLSEISEKQNEINDKVSTINYDKEFSNIFDKTSSIENWLIDSNIKENSAKIAQQMDLTSTTDTVDVINSKTGEIISALENLSKSSNVEDVSKNIINISEKIENIISILKDNSSQAADEEIINKLSDLERSVSEIVSRNEFNDFIEELKYCITKLSTNTGSCTANIEEMQRLQKKIDETLQNLDFTDTANALEGKFDELAKKFENLPHVLDSVPQLQKQIAEVQDSNAKILDSHSDIENNLSSITQFVQNNLPEDNKDIHSKLDEIKSMLEDCANNHKSSTNIEKEAIEGYLKEIKTLLGSNSDNEIYSKIQNIEDLILNNDTSNKEEFSQILERINNLNKLINDNTENNSGMADSINELTSLKSQITNIEDLLKQKEAPSDTENQNNIIVEKTEEFLAEKLLEIKKDIEEISSQNSKVISENITNKTSIIEEKALALQNLIDRISSFKTAEDEGFGEKIAEIKDKFSDFNDELMLIKTDIIENLSAGNKTLLKELTPLKESIERISENADIESLKSQIDDLHNTLMHSEDLSQDNSKFEDLYGRLSERITEEENDLKDFILGDTDAIILKLDDLKDYFEHHFSEHTGIPVISESADYGNFIKSIKDFENEQQNLINNAVNTIQEDMLLQNNEIKSMIEVAQNHDDILAAIENLKKYFKTKISKTESAGENTAVQVFDEDVIDDLRTELNKYADQIEKLSSNNEQISSVLEGISKKLDNLSDISDENIEDFENYANSDEGTEPEPFGENSFDFVQAFDILQNDIRNLSNTVEQLKNSDKNASSQIPSIDENTNIVSLNSKVDNVLKSLNKNWAEEIKEYLETGEIKTKLNQINSKLDVIVSDTSSTDMLEEVSGTLETLDEKVGGIKPEIQKLSESDKKISSMLEELSQKLTEISSDDKGLEGLNDIKNLITEQKDYIKTLEPGEKLDAFKKCLDELSLDLNFLTSNTESDTKQLNKAVKDMQDSITTAIVTIFNQVSFIEESEDIKDFVEERTNEINDNIKQINTQLQQLSSSDNDTDYTYSMQDIETDLAKLRLALNDLQTKNEKVKSDDFKEITDKLHLITSSVDSLSKEEMTDLKSEISTLKEQTRFLIANSDKSCDALNAGIEGFEEILNGSITGKVDKLGEMLEDSAQSDKVVRQALVYIGEWIDNVSESINKISSNSDGISPIKEHLEGLNQSLNNQINTLIEEKFEVWNTQIQKLEKQFEKVESIEEQFSNQQERIDRLEMNIDKLITMVENFDDPTVNRKIDKIEKQISKLSTNIEKLTSYVD